MDISNEKGFFLIPGFENYAINPKKIIVKNLNSDTVIQPLKTAGIQKYKLSKHGTNYYFTVWEIFRMIFSNYKEKTQPK